jgi:hypothetical protein
VTVFVFGVHLEVADVIEGDIAEAAAKPSMTCAKVHGNREGVSEKMRLCKEEMYYIRC